jgi:adenylylsulfate kinase-like enzyme
MYAKARKDIIKDFTGVNAPYEQPLQAEITLDTINYTAEENAKIILDFLTNEKYVLR